MFVRHDIVDRINIKIKGYADSVPERRRAKHGQYHVGTRTHPPNGQGLACILGMKRDAGIRVFSIVTRRHVVQTTYTIKAVGGETPKTVRRAVDFTLQDMNGEAVSFTELKGKVVLLNFWATWCGPCKIEVPWFVEFAEQYAVDGLAVVGVSIDDTADKIQEFSEQYNVNYPMLVGLGQDDFMESYGPIWGVPMTFFIDRDGALCRTHAGIASRDDFEKDITDLL